MRFRSRKLNKAFTLVEILIVVVILGILAAIVVPQFTNATQDATAGNLKSQIKSLQNQIELYAARNNNTYPDLSANWDDLLDPDGVPATNDGYVKQAPSNPAWQTAATRTSVSQAAAGTGSATTAWLFNTADRTLYASFFNETTGLVTQTNTD